MKTLIAYTSYHRMNTEKVAQALAAASNATLRKAADVRLEDLATADLIGLGSGIYGGKHHQALFALTEKIPAGTKVFIFSTSGVRVDQHHQPLRDALLRRGSTIVGEFRCPGETSPLGVNLDLKGSLGWFLGKNRGHPDAQDLENARIFVQGLVAGKS